MGLDGAAMRKPWPAIYGMRHKGPAKASIWTVYVAAFLLCHAAAPWGLVKHHSSTQVSSDPLYHLGVTSYLKTAVLWTPVC